MFAECLGQQVTPSRIWRNYFLSVIVLRPHALWLNLCSKKSSLFCFPCSPIHLLVPRLGAPPTHPFTPPLPRQTHGGPFGSIANPDVAQRRVSFHMEALNIHRNPFTQNSWHLADTQQHFKNIMFFIGNIQHKKSYPKLTHAQILTVCLFNDLPLRPARTARLPSRSPICG